MARTVSIGVHDFENQRVSRCFYVDKSEFIREWWKNRVDVTLFTQPRHFSNTLNERVGLLLFQQILHAGNISSRLFAMIVNRKCQLSIADEDVI